MPTKILLSVIFLISYSIAAAQPTPAKSDENEKLRKAAVEFLRETSLDVGRMRSAENRVSFNAELASLMWFHDEKEARGMYLTAMADFKQLIMQFDAQMNSIDTPAVDEDFSPSFLFGGAGRTLVERKLRAAMMVRQQMALSLAEHDADLALGFFYDTASLISNPEFRRQTEGQDKSFEFQILKQIAASNAEKASKLGIATLKDGIDYNHIDLLKKIYAKDPEKGAEFGQAILAKLRSGDTKIEENYLYSSLLAFGSETLEASKKVGGKKPVYDQSDLREIADLFAKVILESKDDEEKADALGYVGEIEKFSPGRGAQIRSKFRSQDLRKETRRQNLAIAANSAANVVVSNETKKTADSDVAVALEGQPDPRVVNAGKLADAMKDFDKPLAKEERERAVAQARKIISQTPGKDGKIAALSMLAAQVARLGDKELADQIMNDAARMVNPLPKNYKDFLYTWMLASGYAESNPAKAFPLLDDTIQQANETISAFVKVAEFIDVNQEMVSDGEVQVGVFGGSMIRELTQQLGIANVPLVSLAKADFAKTKALTNGFDRVEVRVLAKMLVLRAVLDEKKPMRLEDETAIPVDALPVKRP